MDCKILPNFKVIGFLALAKCQENEKNRIFSRSDKRNRVGIQSTYTIFKGCAL